MIPLHPHGTLRTRVQPGANDDIFRKLGIGARRCDLGDEGLYLAEEIVAADRWLGGSDLEVLGILVLALMIAQRQGSTRLRLDTKSLKSLVGDILHTAGHDADLTRTVKQIIAMTKEPGFGSVIGRAPDRCPLVVEAGCLYTERSRHLEKRVAEKLAARVAGDVAGDVVPFFPVPRRTRLGTLSPFSPVPRRYRGKRGQRPRFLRSRPRPSTLRPPAC
jgi:hypothetical protein